MNRLAVAGAIRLSLFLQKYASYEKFLDYSDVLKLDATLEDLKEIEEGILKGLSFEKASRVEYILSLCKDNELSLAVLELACLRYIKPVVTYLFKYAGVTVKDGVTIELAATIIDLPGGIFENTNQILDTYNSLGILLGAEITTKDIVRDVLNFDFRLSAFCDGVDLVDNEIQEIVEVYDATDAQKIFGYDTEVEVFSTDVFNVFSQNLTNKNSNAFSIIISGENGSGRLVCAKALAQKIDVPLIAVDFSLLKDAEDIRHIILKLVRESHLLMGLICINNIERSDETREVICLINEYFSRYVNAPVIYICDTMVKPVSYLDGQIMSFEVPGLSGNAALEVWEGFLKQLDCASKLDVLELVGKMRLTAGQIYRIVKLIKCQEMSGHSLKTTDVYSLCYQVLDDGRYENIKRVAAGYSLEDLRISEKNKAMLLDVCNQVNNRKRVYDDWNMKTKFAYGRCVSLLLSGVPGTGKTMAVHALANELDLELYKVDLSQIVDKYVGETEKRLEEIFDKAEKSNLILFFDEADAVIGKRSETTDAKDRYANSEVAYILQRMEEYDGIVILATNYVQNIDLAIIRRIKYVVNLEIPDEEIRKEIWQSAFAKEVPMNKDIDWDFLARQFELSGGNIKNIVLNATFLAAQNNEKVGMEHIIRAVARENTKDKRIGFVNDYGNYGYLIQGEFFY